MPLAQGQILKNRYRIARLLGQGGYGAVYKSWDTTLNRPCAVKESFELSPEGQRQFLREAQILANLTHPNLPRVSDFFTLPGKGQYLVMDFVEGHDLEELRGAAGGRLPESQVLPWIAQACDALSYLHRQQPPVIHRDLKPANLKVMPPDEDYPQGRVMLVDFGVAKVSGPARRTTKGARAVTPGYSPPEQYGQSQAVTDTRTDIYALGATLYTLLTGEEPPESVLRMLRDPLIPPRQLNPGISTHAEAAVLKAMQIDPDQRFQSAAEFKAALPVRSAAAPFPWKWLGLGAGLLAGLLLLAGLAGIGIKGYSDSQAAQTTQAYLSQTAEALAAAASLTPSPLPPSPTATPSPLPPSPTATASPLPPSPTATPSPLPPSPTPTSSPVTTRISLVDSMVQVYIPAGTFQMGSDSGDSDEQPVHTVTLDAFWMDQTEVTNAMYAQCVAASACSPPGSSSSYSRSSYYGNAEYDNYPVIHVDWNQAEAYCTWAGRQLPSEAQWEYAARGTDGRSYPWGNDFNGTLANFCDVNCIFNWLDAAFDDGYADTAPVGSYPAGASPFGVLDLAGNVCEWVNDWYDLYSSAAVENPTGPLFGISRVHRGGSWYGHEYLLRSALRGRDIPSYSSDSFGFRCVRSPGP